MELTKSQELFVRLNLDASFRDEALAAPGGSAACFGHLAQEIRRSARSLVSKRLFVVRRILGATRLALGDSFVDEFRAYAASNSAPRGINRHRLDALAFARWLADRTRRGVFSPAVLDLLAHESAPVRMWTKKRRRMVLLHRRAPGSILHLAQEGIDLAKAPLRPAVVIWREATSRGFGYRWQQYSL